ncbi:MAG: alpha/beta hydrolase [Microcella sp.]|uniref:alpha/beta fold hydrolase n=1 Tax=Microcella sp. TaxID=1913979 RepID=UPI0033161810
MTAASSHSSSPREFDVTLPDDRTLHGYDAGPAAGIPVLWHHGTPNTGPPPTPLLDTAASLGLRWVSFDRPAYGGSTRLEGRTVVSVAADAAAFADALELETFAVMGHSGGGPHALACAAELPERVSAVVSIAGLAPFDAAGLDWFEGMGTTSSASLRAALDGVERKRRHEESSADAAVDFTARDWATLAGPWAWLAEIAAAGVATGLDGMIDDDLAYVTRWGVDLGAITAPVLLLHGDDDRVVPAGHSRWLASALPGSEHWALPEEGHLSVLAAEERGAEDALQWLAQSVDR